MDFHKYIQPMFAATLTLLAILLMFVAVPPTNAEYFKTLLTALISFISGAAVATAFSKKDSQPPNDQAGQ